MREAPGVGSQWAECSLFAVRLLQAFPCSTLLLLQLWTIRYKFDDERVTKEELKRALEEQYGGEEEVRSCVALQSSCCDLISSLVVNEMVDVFSYLKQTLVSITPLSSSQSTPMHTCWCTSGSPIRIRLYAMLMRKILQSICRYKSSAEN